MEEQQGESILDCWLYMLQINYPVAYHTVKVTCVLSLRPYYFKFCDATSEL